MLGISGKHDPIGSSRGRAYDQARSEQHRCQREGTGATISVVRVQIHDDLSSMLTIMSADADLHTCAQTSVTCGFIRNDSSLCGATNVDRLLEAIERPHGSGSVCGLCVQY